MKAKLIKEKPTISEMIELGKQKLEANKPAPHRQRRWPKRAENRWHREFGIFQ